VSFYELELFADSRHLVDEMPDQVRKPVLFIFDRFCVVVLVCSQLFFRELYLLHFHSANVKFHALTRRGNLSSPFPLFLLPSYLPLPSSDDHGRVWDSPAGFETLLGLVVGHGRLQKSLGTS